MVLFDLVFLNHSSNVYHWTCTLTLFYSKLKFLGAIYVYLTKLPVLGCACGTRLSYLTSLKEVINGFHTVFLWKYYAFYWTQDLRSFYSYMNIDMWRRKCKVFNTNVNVKMFSLKYKKILKTGDNVSALHQFIKPVRRIQIDAILLDDLIMT